MSTVSKIKDSMVEKYVNNLQRFGSLWCTIERLWSWIPVIRADVDYDATSLYLVIRHKLLRTQDTLLNGFAEHESKDIEALDRAIDLCTLLNAEEHLDKELVDHDVKWGESVTEYIDQDEGYAILRFSRPMAVTEEDKATELEEYRVRLDTSLEKAQADKDELFKILSDHIQTWWE